jgi:hypothetical protein
MIPDFGTILAVVVVAAIIGGLFWYSRRSPEKQAKIRAEALEAAGDAGEAFKAMRDLAARAIDRLHDSMPANPAPAAQINAGEAIAARAAPTYAPAPIAPQTTIERAGAILAADVPGTGQLPAGVRYATDADLAAGVPPIGGNVWPQTWVLSDGAGTRVLAKAPLSTLYRTSQMGTIMGRPFAGGGGHAADPANGDEANPPLPLRSPAGFPVRYTLVNGVVVGTASVMWGDNAFNSDAEVLDYIRRTTLTPEQVAANKAKWDAYYERVKARAAQEAGGTVNVEIEGG